MFYQVTVKRKDSKAQEIEALNLSRESLELRLLDPYQQGGSITLKGTTVQCSEIDRIRIVETRAEINVSDVIGRLDLQVQGFTYSRDERDVTDDFITGPPGEKLEVGSQRIQGMRPVTGTREVFVVHGRNEIARKAIFVFLRSIGLDPLEWAEAAHATGKPTPYIGEILDAAFSRAHAVVVLFTPDDEARLREPFQSDSDPPYETQLTGQARPNVLFEAGMAMERDQDRTVLVELGSLRPFSDIAGRHTIRLDNSGQQRQQLAKRLQSAGCPVNLEGPDWLTAGDFEAAVVATVQESSEPTAALERQSASDEALKLSDDAKDLLMEAAEDSRGTILAISTFGGLSISTNGRNFVEVGGPQVEARSEARWKQAFRELVDHVLIEDPTGKGQIFQVTQSGFQVADNL